MQSSEIHVRAATRSLPGCAPLIADCCRRENCGTGPGGRAPRFFCGIQYVGFPSLSPIFIKAYSTGAGLSEPRLLATVYARSFSTVSSIPVSLMCRPLREYATLHAITPLPHPHPHPHPPSFVRLYRRVLSLQIEHARRLSPHRSYSATIFPPSAATPEHSEILSPEIRPPETQSTDASPEIEPARLGCPHSASRTS